MAEGEISPKSHTRDVVAWILHLALYSCLLFAYFLLVLRYCADWFATLFHQHRIEYAFVAIVVMIVQAVVLESISALILRWFNIVRK